MRFTKVSAGAFGPLSNAELDLAEGLTVVWGPNEAAKSSWHAAIYAALCGRRRRAGTATDQAFERKHKPWDRDEWSVAAEIVLDDGRRVSIARDLAERRSDVVDMAFGRPIDDEIMFDGAPDGARWLGLDRTTFLSTACVRQADIVGVTAAPDALKHLLQQAASSLGGTVTASEALGRLSNFRRDEVGRDRANAVKPLRIAVEQVAAAEVRLDEVRQRHEAYLGVLASHETASERVRVARARVAEVERGLERARWRHDITVASRLAELKQRLGSQPEQQLDDTTFELMQGCVNQWDALPEPVALTGPTSAELRAVIAALPPEPTHDTTVAQEVAEAFEALRVAEASLTSLGDAPELGDYRSEYLQSLAAASRVLESEPIDVAGPQAAVQQATDRDHQVATRRAMVRRFGAAAVLAAVSGVLLLVAGQTVLGIALVGLATVAGVAVGGAVATSSMLSVDTAADLDQLTEVLASRRAAAADLEREQAAVRVLLADLGLPDQPAVLATMSDAAAASESQAQQWVTDKTRREAAVSDAEVRLAAALFDRGIDVGDVRRDVESYRHEVAAAAAQAEQRRQGDLTAERLSLRIEQEQRDAQRRQARAEVLVELRGYLAAAGHVDDHDSDDSVVASARAVLATAAQARRVAAELAGLSVRIDQLLAGRTEAEVVQAASRAQSQLAHNDGPINTTEDQAAAARALAAAEQELAEVRGTVSTYRESDIDVSVAEAELAAAERELDRVHRLAAVLDRTMYHLSAAEEQAFRIIAPRLAQEVTDALPDVTDGRYVDASVDPETLEVSVRDTRGRHRNAGALSHGTTEQIYLLLRIAMTRLLTNPAEACPIIIDDATVHSDQGRTEALLRLLQRAARDQQVVLFSQEQQVIDWAEANLGDRDRCVRLERVASFAT